MYPIRKMHHMNRMPDASAPYQKILRDFFTVSQNCWKHPDQIGSHSYTLYKKYPSKKKENGEEEMEKALSQNSDSKNTRSIRMIRNLSRENICSPLRFSSSLTKMDGKQLSEVFFSDGFVSTISRGRNRTKRALKTPRDYPTSGRTMYQGTLRN
jgi:hypothetical protein